MVLKLKVTFSKLPNFNRRLLPQRDESGVVGDDDVVAGWKWRNFDDALAGTADAKVGVHAD